MDTRAKILTPPEAANLPLPLRAVVGFFDPLLAAHVRRLNELASPETKLIAVILNPQQPLLDLRARAELVAALAIIDFVVPMEGDCDAFLRSLPTADIIHEETSDQLRTAHLIEHVHSDTNRNSEPGILIVRLGAMGDVIHTLPAAASLKHNFPSAPLAWVVESAWAPLLEDNPFIDRVIVVGSQKAGHLVEHPPQPASRRLRARGRFPGTLKVRLTASLARPDQIFGFHVSQLRERAAAWFYSKSAQSESVHAVDRNLDLARTAGAASLLGTSATGGPA